MKAEQAGAVERALELGPLSLDRAVPGLALLVAGLGVALGCLSLAARSFDSLPIPLFGVLTVALAGLLVLSWRRTGVWDIGLAVLLVLAALSALALSAMPEYIYGHNVNGIIHRSIVSSVLLFAVAVPATCTALYYFLGATPSAHDVSRYPIIILPIALAAVGYVLVLTRLLEEGVPDLDLSLITHAYNHELTGTQFVNQEGLRNHILGTLLLVFLTSLIALPVGVGTGMYLAEYDDWLARVIDISATLLRAISVFVLAVAAFSLVQISQSRAAGDPISDLVRGSYVDSDGFTHAAHGSFLLAAVFLSLLVIPVVARSTEEGFRSVPREIREGSVALGATEGHALLRILLPWTLPNIITALLIGAAEVAGSVAVIILIAGDGEFGVGPLHGVTSLSFFIFEADYGPQAFKDTNSHNQFAAAVLLLVITLAFSVAAIYLRQRFSRRYRGGLTG